ncbi:MAG: MFS transporter [Clostridiales bacterium]|nr:MFS transporter [Clostridiales bacterium]
MTQCPETAGHSSGLLNPSAGAYRRLATTPAFARLWTAQAVSGVGDWLVIGLLMPLVTSLSGGSPLAVAGILIAKLIPSLLLSSVTGALVDRFDRRRLMIACDLARAALTLGLLFTQNLAFIYLVVFLMEVASLFFYPARNALIPRLVAKEDVAAANGLAYTTQQASMLVGLTASGAILAGFEAIVRVLLETGLPFVETVLRPFGPALLGPLAGVFVNSLTFLVSAALITRIRCGGSDQLTRARLNVRMLGADVRDSLRFLREHSELRGLLVTIALAILGGGAIVPLGLVRVQRMLVEPVPLAGEFEWLDALIAVPQTFLLVFLALGMVVGALMAPRFTGRVRLQLLFSGGVALFGGAMLAFGLVDAYVVLVLAALVAGACIATVTVAGNTYVVNTVADAIRGRVFTALEAVVRVSLLLSMIVVAPLGDLAVRGVERVALETRTTLWFSGEQAVLVAASFVVLGAAVYAFKTLDWRGPEEDVRGG